MAPQQKDANMAEGLKKILGDLAQLMAAPDADMEFISAIQQAISSKIKSGMGAPGQQPGGQPQPPQSPTGMAGANPGAPTGLSATGGGAGIDMAGGQAGMPNMDEMNRALGSSSKAS